jgi:hypothetical protein
MPDLTPRRPKQASPEYDRLLRGEISSKQYVESLKQAKREPYMPPKRRRDNLTIASLAWCLSRGSCRGIPPTEEGPSWR